MIKLSTKERINSLDTLRGVAIILVIIRHYTDFITNQNNFGIISQIGWIGVDLFFVLSGYLISNHIFKELSLNKFSLIKFYIKRFFKTLPSYYFVLILYFFLPGFTEKPIQVPLWKYLIFIQNYNLPTSGFSQSWSLCVEEQFYLFFPFLAMWLYPKRKKIFLYVLLFMIIGGMLIRGMLWYYLTITNNLNFEHYKTTIYYPTYCRLDGFIGGIILAYIQNYKNKIWQHITSFSNRFLWIGMVLIFMSIIIIALRYPFLNSTITYPSMSLGFSLMVIAAFSQGSILTKFQSLFLSKLARWSYAIYLSQKPISVICANYFTKIGLDNNEYLVILLNFTIQIFVGYLMYTIIESNFMTLRERLLKRLG